MNYFNLCDRDFTQKARIDGLEYSIDEYFNKPLLQAAVKLKGFKIACSNDHPLTAVHKSNRSRAYFRHTYTEDIYEKEGIWHKNWKSNFKQKEIPFNKKGTQKKDRRADVHLAKYKKVIEFQHSPISREEVNERKFDYMCHDHKIIWIIDGNNFIKHTKLEHSNRIYLEFERLWKFESFIEYNIVYIDINEEIYRIFPQKIKSCMIDVQLPVKKKDFIKALKKNEHDNLWSTDETYQSQLYIKQQGAGNGKTYGIIQMLLEDKFSHYNSFIFVTKQHSAKAVLYNEFKDQQQRGLIPNLILNEDPKEYCKKYIIKYTNNKSKKECRIIIGTIDSLVYALGDKNHNNRDKFVGLVRSIIDNYNTSKGKNVMNYSGLYQVLNKETLLVIDEIQDLPISYAKAVIQIMRNTYIDAYVVGDLLQSITYDQNAFRYLYENEFSNIKKIKNEPTNICRRFTDKRLVDFVNTTIPFEKHELPTITPYKSTKSKENPVIIINSDNKIYNTYEANDAKIEHEIDILMKLFDEEVNKNQRIPEDFLVITPFTNINVLVDKFNLAINEYWIKKMQEPKYRKNVLEKNAFWKGKKANKYRQYSVFHKSVDGTAIDLDESNHSTRIVSIHSSKGDGRKVVFVVGMNESALHCFQTTTNTLQYNSLIHVAFTRMKEKIYVRLDNPTDDLAQRINKYQYENGILTKPNLTLTDKFKWREIIHYSKNDTKLFEIFNENIIKPCELPKLPEENTNKYIIDMRNHIMRYAVILNYIYIQIYNKEQKDKSEIHKELTHQIYYRWKDVAHANRITAKSCNEYYKYLGVNTEKENEEKNIVMIALNEKSEDYKKYYNIIAETINNVTDKINKYFTRKKCIGQNFCPFENLILTFCILQIEAGAYTTINAIDLYEIVHIYANSFDKSDPGHNNCECSKLFKKPKIIIHNSHIKNMRDYIKNHYDSVDKMNNIMKKIFMKYPKISWNTNKYIGYKLCDITINKRFQLIGNDKDNVYVCYIKPQFNGLNYNEVLTENIFDTYLIKQVKEDKRFEGKKVIGIVISLDLNEPYYIDWKNLVDDNYSLIELKITEYIKGMITDKTHELYNFFKYHRKNRPTKYKEFPGMYIREKYREFVDNSKDKSPIKYLRQFIDKFDKDYQNNDTAKYNTKIGFDKEFKEHIENYFEKDDDTDDDNNNEGCGSDIE